MTKMIKISGVLVLFFSILAACNNTDVKNATDDQNGAVTENPTTNEGNNEENNSTTNNTNAVHNDYNFNEFDLDVDFEGQTDVIEVDYDYDEKDNKIEAKYKNDLENIHLTGDEAMETLDEIFRSFNFDENTPNEEVIRDVISAFNIPDDAKIDLDIEYNNGTEKEYK